LATAGDAWLKNMGFDTEPTGYEKTILSDLQGAWQCLRGEVAENPGFNGCMGETPEALSNGQI